DLLVGKGKNLPSRQRQNTNWDTLPQHGNADGGAKIAQMQSGRKCVFGIGLDVGNVDDPTVYQRSPSNRTPIHLNRRFAHVVGILRRIAVGCRAKECLADLASNSSLVGIALARS